MRLKEKTIPRTWISFINGLHSLSQASKVKLFSTITVLLVIHLALSFTLRDFTWLAAFGALLSIFGLFSSFSYSFPLEEISPRDLAPTKEGDTYHLDGFNFGEVITDRDSIEKIKQSKIDSALEKYKNISLYFILTVCGTITWAYAGFLNVLFPSCA